jgi:hypothetical protein
VVPLPDAAALHPVRRDAVRKPVDMVLLLQPEDDCLA